MTVDLNTIQLLIKGSMDIMDPFSMVSIKEFS